MDLTEIRKEIQSKLKVEPSDRVRVLVGAGPENEAWDATITVRIAAGTESEATLERVDKFMNPEGGVKEMLDSVGDWESFDDLSVVKCSGHIMYPTANGPPLIGAEWTVKVMA